MRTIRFEFLAPAGFANMVAATPVAGQAAGASDNAAALR